MTCWICAPEGGCLTPDECGAEQETADRVKREQALDELTALSQQMGLYDDDENPLDRSGNN